jgi:hemerythrin-like domain-containing protein
MERAEQTLHPAMERLMQNRHSMTPMRREHQQLRRLIDELAELRVQPMELGVQLRLRRVLYQMYALLKVHLAEEDAYLGILEHNLSPEEEDRLAGIMARAAVDPIA